MSEEEFYNSFTESFLTHHNLYRSAKIKKVNYKNLYYGGKSLLLRSYIVIATIPYPENI